MIDHAEGWLGSWFFLRAAGDHEKKVTGLTGPELCIEFENPSRKEGYLKNALPKRTLFLDRGVGAVSQWYFILRDHV